ncbi:MAG: hypothetical protein ABIB79_03600 [archaeon]
MTNFLWHKVSDKEREDIKKQAKAIMDDFSKKLSKVNREMSEPLIERPEGDRPEGKQACSEIDRETFFANTPSKNKDFIVAEKKGW